jgi:hypothetical protein
LCAHAAGLSPARGQEVLQPGQIQELAGLGAGIEDLDGEVSAATPGGGPQSHQGSDAAAIEESRFGEVDFNALNPGSQLGGHPGTEGFGFGVAQLWDLTDVKGVTLLYDFHISFPDP